MRLMKDAKARRNSPWFLGAIAYLALSQIALSQTYGKPFPEGVYRYDIVGATNGISDGLTGAVTFFGAPSLNNNGLVAFPCTTTVGGAICTGDGINPQSLAGQFESPGVQYIGIHIDDNGLITATKQNPGPSYVLFQINSQSNTLTNTVATGSPTITSDDFDAVFGDVSANKLGNAVFAGLDRHVFIGSDICLNTACLATPTNSGVFGTKFNELPVISPIRPQIADTGSIVVRFQNTTTTPPIVPLNTQQSIEVLDYTLANPVVLKTLNALTSPPSTPTLGLSPGISADGQLVAYAVIGNGIAASNEGIYVAWNAGSGFDPINNVVQVAGTRQDATAELGYGDVPATGPPPPLFLTNFDPSARVSVIHQSLGNAGLVGDCAVVAFMAQPSGPSRLVPNGTSPLFFSAQPGIWSVKVTFDPPPNQPGSATFKPHVNSPVLVAQVGDIIQTANGPATVTALSVYEQLAGAATELDGKTVRTQRCGDHRIAFLAITNNGSYVIRASFVDSDQDGLPDHWEQPEDIGIDWNRDGIADLKLTNWGADRLTRDIFVQLDWVTDRVSGRPAAYSHQPPSTVTRDMNAFFAGADALQGSAYGFTSDGSPPTDIPAGIKLHADAGTATDAFGLNGDPLSLNASTNPAELKGGTEVFYPNTLLPPDVVYFGDDDPSAICGLLQCGALKTLSLQAIKDNVIARDPAREAIFHHVVIADFYSVLQSGLTVTSATQTSLGFSIPAVDPNATILITQSKSAQGEIRRIASYNTTTNIAALDEAWNAANTPAVGDQFVLLSSSSGKAEADLSCLPSFPCSDYWTFKSKPGNDLIVATGAFPANRDMNNVPIPGKYRGTSSDIQRTIEHELGHTMGLRHGGSDDINYKKGYYSVMSYCYQFGAPDFSDPLAAPCDNFAVSSYAHLGNAVFADWLNLRLDLTSNAPALGNSLSLNASGTSAGDRSQPELSQNEIEQLFGPRDATSPSISILTPSANASFAVGQTLTVTLTAVDNVAIKSVMVGFDLNGDGLLDSATEVVQANLIGNTYSASFAGTISGPSGKRLLRAVAEDTSANQTPTSISLSVGSSATMTVPNVVGLTQAAATSAITGAGLTVGAVSTSSSSTVPSGNVISESPVAGTSVASGSAVSLVVSTGPASVAVPNVVGSTQAAATTAITSAGLTLGTVTTQSSSTVAAGLVISESPAAGTSVAAKSAVNLVVSSGAAAVSVPNVVGLTQAAATATITGVGLSLGTVTTQSSSTVAAGLVISETPTAGTSVAAKSAVTLVVSSGAAPVTVPNVIGLTQATATTSITAAGLTLGSVTTQSSATIAAGLVISETPTAGTSVAAKSAVSLVVSSGAAPVGVPNVVGLTQAAATTAITTAGLTLGSVTTQSSATIAAGLVISESPTAGTSVAAKSAVSLIVSSGAAPVLVPNVIGLTQAAATSAITSAGLALGSVTTQSSSTVAAGLVISESPTAGTSVSAKSAVSLIVSSGAAPVAVPNVVGLTQTAATTAITGAGLTLGSVTTQSSATVAAGVVISESPVAGTSVAAKSAVSLVVSTGPAPVSVPNVVGATQATATTAITNAGLVVGAVTNQSSSTVAAGIVISESPAAGTSVAAKSAVSLMVSTGSLLGDLNGDGVVNCTDLAIIKASFGKKVGQAGFDARADVNKDGVVNVLDLSTEARLMPAGTSCN
jgi:beta-lactam-binding protein with PASTA domain